MKNIFKQFIKNTVFYWPLHNWLNKFRQKKQVSEWKKKGRPAPPPHKIKQEVLREYAEKYKLNVLVETGTLYGDMVEAMKKVFDKIYSIELNEELFKIAKKRFKSEKHIEIVHGDSGKELINILKKISEPALFWLDGHYSGGLTSKGEEETPIYQELQNILNSKERRHIIIIDDARCFGTNPAYPTIDAIKKFIFSIKADISINIQDDSIRVVPK